MEIGKVGWERACEGWGHVQKDISIGQEITGEYLATIAGISGSLDEMAPQAQPLTSTFSSDEKHASDLFHRKPKDERCLHCVKWHRRIIRMRKKMVTHNFERCK